MFVAFPVRAGQRRQLERLDFSRRRKVRTRAKVNVVALFVKTDFFAFGQFFDKLDFVNLALIFHKFKRVLSRKNKAGYGQVCLDNLVHFRLDFVKVVLSDGRFEIEVVIKTVFDGRTDCKFYRGINVFYRLCENVRRGMTINFFAFVVGKSQHFERAVVFDDGGQVFQCAVNFHGDRVSCKTFADFLCGVKESYAVFNFQNTSVFQSKFCHIVTSF